MALFDIDDPNIDTEELERRVKALTAGEDGPRRRRAEPAPANPHLRDLEQRLGEHLGTRVQIMSDTEKGAGRLIVHFFSLDEFEGLMDRMHIRLDDSPGS